MRKLTSLATVAWLLLLAGCWRSSPPGGVPIGELPVDEAPIRQATIRQATGETDQIPQADLVSVEVRKPVISEVGDGISSGGELLGQTFEDVIGSPVNDLADAEGDAGSSPLTEEQPPAPLDPAQSLLDAKLATQAIDAEIRSQRLSELRAQLSDIDVDSRFAAVVELADFAAEDVEARRSLVTALGDENRDVVVSARRSLRQLGEAAVPELVAAIEDPTSNVRIFAVQTVARLEPDAAHGAVGSLLAALGDEDESLRAAAATALVHQADSSEVVVPSLIELLRDADGNVRANAARALGGIGGGAAAALAALQAAAADEDDFWAARAAKQAIRSIAPGPRKTYP